MHKLKWFKALEVGVEVIDNDHREMMNMLQRIQDAIREQSLDISKELINEFILLTRLHFTAEEKILEETNFPNLKQHRVVHGKLLAQAIDLGKIVLNATHVDELSEHLDDLAGFLFHDVIGSDMEFKSYLQECGAAELG